MKSLPPELPQEVLAVAADSLAGAPDEVELAWMSWAGTTWRLSRQGAAVYVKRASDLTGERDRLAWLAGRWPVPELVAFVRAAGDEWLVTRGVRGVPMAQAAVGWPAARVARRFGEILKRLHATEPSGCPFGTRKPGNVLIHGDYCLPNVLVVDGELSAVVDVGRAGLGNPEDDLAAGLWTLQYNYGAGFGRVFLEAYGWPPLSDEALERLRRRYNR